MARLSISLLGRMEITYKDTPVTTIESDKGRAMLAYLAVEANHPHSREALAGLLWPDWPEQAARQNLRQSLYNLRQALDISEETAGPFLLVTSRHIQFNTASDHWLDVTAFTTLLDTSQAHAHRRLDACTACIHRLQTAADLYRGDFLAGFSLPDSDTFEEWRTFMAEELHRRAVDVFTHLATYHERRRDYEVASRYLQRQLELEPWREESHQQLMQVLALSGQRSAALQQYEHCCSILAEELGIEPSAETMALYQRIKAGHIQPDLVEAQNPYKGLHAFAESDATDFFGREAFTERLFKIVHQQPLVVVIGASGSGKSSVIQAGLLPRLSLSPHLTSPAANGEQGREDKKPEMGETWHIASFRPGRDPFRAIADAMIPLIKPRLNANDSNLQALTHTITQQLHNGELSLPEIAERILHQTQQPNGHPSRLLLIADHFEELYTLCSEPATRRAFLDLLFQPFAITPSHPAKLTLLLSVRADFVSQALSYRPLADAMQRGGLVMGPMNRAELRRAIEEPARGRGVIFEPGLVERLLQDVGEESGNLPLLQFALTLLWELRAGSQMSHATYEEIGGVTGALTSYADLVYEELIPAEQELAQRVFLQMVRPGEGTEDSRRLATRDELGEQNWVLVHQLANSRLVVTNRNSEGQETAELVHEVLIQHWDRLRTWLETDRAFHIWQGRLRAAFRQWEASNHDEEALLRGTLLAEAERWAEERADDLSPRAKAFLAASRESRNRKLAEAEIHRRREVEQIQALAEAEHRRADVQAKASRRLRWLAIGLALVLTLAILASVQAIGQWREAQHQATLALSSQATAEAERARAEEQTGIALSRQLAAQAINLIDNQPDLALLLSLEANSRATTTAMRKELLTSMELSPFLAKFLHGHTQPIYYLAIGPNTLADAGDDTLTAITANGTTQQWHLADGKRLGQSIPDQGEEVIAALSANGQTAAIGKGSSITLWNVTTGRTMGPPLTNHSDTIRNLALNADGSVLVSGSADGTILVWSLIGDSPQIRPPDQPLSYEGSAAWALSPNGDDLAIVQEETLTVWNVRTGQEIGAPLTIHPGFGVHSLTFNPEGNIVASSSFDKTVILWDVEKGEALHPPLAGHERRVLVSAFSPDGRILASGSTDNTINLWDVTTGEVLGPPLKGHSNWVRSLVFSADGETLISGSADGKIILWDLSKHQRLTGHGAQVRGVAFSPNALHDTGVSTLASGSFDNTAILWDVRTGKPIGAPLAAHTNLVLNVAFSPNGRKLATASADNTIILWDVATRQPLDPVLIGHDGPVISLAFSPNSSQSTGEPILTSGSMDSTAILWDVSTGQPLGPPLTGHKHWVIAVAFSPDGQTLATGSGDNTIILWDVATRKPLGPPLTGHSNWVTSLAFSPDGQTLVSGSSDNTIIVWDVATRQPRGLPLTGHAAQVWSVLFNPLDGGNTLISGAADGTVILWDLAEQEPLAPPLISSAEMETMSLSPDGQMLAIGSFDTIGTVNLWQIDWRPWPIRACAIANRNLTDAEWQQYLGTQPYKKTCPELP